MQTLLLVILIGLVSGAAIGMQSPMANMISQRLGVLESVVLVHLGGAVVGLLVLLVTVRGVGNLTSVSRAALVSAGGGCFRADRDCLIQLHHPKGGGDGFGADHGHWANGDQLGIGPLRFLGCRYPTDDPAALAGDWGDVPGGVVDSQGFKLTEK